MSCRRLLPLVLLGLLVVRAIDLGRAGDLDPVTLLLVPVAIGAAVWVVRQPACPGGACDVAVGPDPGATAEEPAAADR